MRIQQGWLTRDSNSLLGHFRKSVIDENGKENRKPVARRLGPADMDEREALEELRRWIVEETGITSDGSVTLEGFIKSRWIPLHEGDWRESSKETITQKLGTIYEHFNGVALKDVDSVQLQSWVNSLAKTKSASTVKMTRAYLKSIFSEATEQDYIRKNPARRLRVPKQLKAVKRAYLTMEEINTLLESAISHVREYALLRLVLVTAMRPSEALALRWRNIDLTPGNETVTLDSTIYRGVLRPFTKNTVEGEVPRMVLEPLAAQVLAEWSAFCLEQSDDEQLDPDAFIFPDSEGGFLHVGNYLHRTLQPLAKAAGIKKVLTFQVLRRTVLTWAASLGSMKDTQAIARHKTAQLTANTYAQIIAPSVRETAGKLGEMMAPVKVPAVN